MAVALVQHGPKWTQTLSSIKLSLRLQQKIVSSRLIPQTGCLTVVSAGFHNGPRYKRLSVVPRNALGHIRIQEFQSLTKCNHRHLSSFGFPKIFSVSAASPLDEGSFPGSEEVVSSVNVASPVVEGSFSGSEEIVSSVDFAASASHSVSSDSVEAATQAAIDSIAYIPAPPALPEAAAPVLNALGEPTFASLGLGGWTPIGLIQNSLEFLHVTFDLPWWGTIAIATMCMRSLIFPLVLIAQRNAAKMNNNLPQLQVLQMKMTEARNAGNQLEAARLGQEMMNFMKEKDISPMKNVVVPLAQAPIFISMFMGLRKMANLPVESMKDGGMLWFTDLTMSDPLYLLPIVTSLTMMATIELGTDGAKLSAQNMNNMKWVLRGMPLIVFPFTLQFPAAVLCYWVTTNAFSLVQVGFLKIPVIRSFFNIDKAITHKAETLPQKKKGVIAGFKESWSNMQISKEIEERQRYDEMRFTKAGSGPVVRTYKHDPTRRPVINVQAKVKGRNVK